MGWIVFHGPCKLLYLTSVYIAVRCCQWVSATLSLSGIVLSPLSFFAVIILSERRHH